MNKIVIGLLFLAIGAAIAFWIVTGEDETPVANTSSEQASNELPANDQQGSETSDPVVETIAASEVAIHNQLTDCWSIVNGKVYNLTNYVPNHPGGEAEISQACGTDATALFTGSDPDGRRHSGNAQSRLDSLYLADLAQ